MAKEWTAREDEIIRATYVSMGPQACADALRSEGYDRGSMAISRRAREIGVVEKSDSPLDHKWTRQELDVIRRAYPTGGAELVRAMLEEMGYERTRSAITTRANVLGVRGKTTDEWSDAELGVMRSVYPTGGAEAVAKALHEMGKERTIGAINTRASMMGVKMTNTKRRMTKGGDKVVRNICLDTELDRDVIERLDSRRNRSQYVRDLVRNDIR